LEQEVKIREKDAEHVDKDADLIRTEIEELKQVTHDKKVDHDGLELDLDGHEKHNKIIYDQNVKITDELDNLERIETLAARVIGSRPVHTHLPSYLDEYSRDPRDHRDHRDHRVYSHDSRSPHRSHSRERNPMR
jgi:hypothetical protein